MRGRIETSDEDLIGMVKDGDVRAFGRLYDRHAARAYRVAYSVCGDAGRSEEAVQDGFLSIWRRRDAFTPADGTFRSWSMRIVRNAAIDGVRTAAALKRPRLAELADETADRRAKLPEDQLVERHQARALHLSLRRLPEAQAEVISLAFFGGLTHTEIANQLDLPPGTVKGRMRLGMEKLRRLMERVAA